MTELPPRLPPRATYRLQMSRDFTFRDAAKIADYLAALGISHVYLSPILMARPGSEHGYDVVDHDRLNPELGSEQDFDDLVATLRRRQLGILLDIVPNHMGIGPDNRRWMDVLEWGENSSEAGFFDIDWQAPRADLVGKVLLPVLAANVEGALAAGDIALAFDLPAGRLDVSYGDHRFPLHPACYAEILTAVDSLRTFAQRFMSLAASDNPAEHQRLRQELAATIGANADTRAALDAALRNLSIPTALGPLLDRQNWRLDGWRKASTDINYRRFFAINDLIGIRVECDDVFAASHRTVFRLIGEGKIDGVRIDHIDGLRDPKAYLDRLHAAIVDLNRPAYILIEKILGADEGLPQARPVAGTTGYDRLGSIDRLFIAPGMQSVLSALYRDFSGDTRSFEHVLNDSKRRFLETEYQSEVSRVARQIEPLARHHLSPAPDLAAIEQALRAIVVALPVYRAYVDENGPGADDLRRIDDAIARANIDAALGSLLRAVLTLDLADRRDVALAIAQQFQQLSGPAMAKGTEDTAFYRHVPLVALDEVGGDPESWALTPLAFHRLNLAKLRTHPDEMIAGSTHDTKRGEDARARLISLGALAEEWGACVRLWHTRHAGLRRMVSGQSAPTPKDEYYLYQTLVGAWPTTLEADDDKALAEFAARIEAAVLKAAREAKERTSWNRPDALYETAIRDFVQAVLTDADTVTFRHDMVALIEQAGLMGALTSLSATLLRLTTPGVPDIYQGSEKWNLALVDPDNRSPVDFAAAQARLAELQQRSAPGGGPEVAGAMLRRWRDGLIKTHLIERTLATRRRLPDLFARGAYESIVANGTHASRLVVFSRRWHDDTAIVVAPRFWTGPYRHGGNHWDDTTLTPQEGAYVNVLTNEWMQIRAGEPLDLDTLLRNFPVALLVSA